MPTRATASRVRAIYPFVTHEKGELSFDKGDVIKVIDRMYDEWYTGAVGGRIGIFPVSYVVRPILHAAILSLVLMPPRMDRNPFPIQLPRNCRGKRRRKPRSLLHKVSLRARVVCRPALTRLCSICPGMIVNLQRMLDGLDPSRGDRLDDPELENMYQKVVELQPQIVSLMKKYADQRGGSFSIAAWGVSSLS